MSSNNEQIDLKKYLHQNWMLNDTSIVDLYKLSNDDRTQIMSRSKRDQVVDTLEIGEFTLLNNESENVLFYTKDFKQVSVVGVKPTTPYFQFQKDGQEFLSQRFKYIENSSLLQSLTLEFNDESIRKIERHIHQNEPSRIELEKQFLSLLAFCGEYMCHKLNGSWYIHYEDESSPSWYPFIEVDGKYYDVFSHFYEALFEASDVPPIILLQETSIIELKKKSLFNKSFLPQEAKEIDFTELGKQQLELLKAEFPNWEFIRELPENNNFAIYKLRNEQVLMTDKQYSKGILFQSEEDYNKFYASIKE